jgi:hypothetical protein
VAKSTLVGKMLILPSSLEARLSTRMMASVRPPRIIDEGVSCGCQNGPKSSRMNRATLRGGPAACPGQEFGGEAFSRATGEKRFAADSRRAIAAAVDSEQA